MRPRKIIYEWKDICAGTYRNNKVGFNKLPDLSNTHRRSVTVPRKHTHTHLLGFLLNISAQNIYYTRLGYTWGAAGGKRKYTIVVYKSIRDKHIKKYSFTSFR